MYVGQSNMEFGGEDDVYYEAAFLTKALSDVHIEYIGHVGRFSLYRF